METKQIIITAIAMLPFFAALWFISVWMQPEGTGAHAEVYDGLFVLYWSIGATVSTMVYGWFIWLLTTSDQDQDEPEDAPEMFVLPPERENFTASIGIFVVIFIILMALFVGTHNAVEFFEHPETNDDTVEIRVTGHQYYWSYEYVGANISYTSLDAALLVPVDTPIVFVVTSDDVFHNFALPEHRIKADAIPGRDITIWLNASETGEYPVRCFELCGDEHATMIGHIDIIEQADFAARYADPANFTVGYTEGA